MKNRTPPDVEAIIVELSLGSLTVSLLDEPLIRLWDAPVKTAALSW